MFEEMVASMRKEVANRAMSAIVVLNPNANRQKQQMPTTLPTSPQGTVVNKGKTIGRNDACPCGSGKKYKNCCGK